jgi:hypothetical protein
MGPSSVQERERWGLSRSTRRRQVDIEKKAHLSRLVRDGLQRGQAPGLQSFLFAHSGSSLSPVPPFSNSLGKATQQPLPDLTPFPPLFPKPGSWKTLYRLQPLPCSCLVYPLSWQDRLQTQQLILGFSSVLHFCRRVLTTNTLDYPNLAGSWHGCLAGHCR